MNSNLNTSPAHGHSRDELARQVLDIICHPNLGPADELDYWLGMIQGTADYLYASADRDHFRHDDGARPDQIAAIAGLLQKSAAICRILAAGMGAEKVTP